MLEEGAAEFCCAEPRSNAGAGQGERAFFDNDRRMLMRCFVASDDASIANQIGLILVQLHHDCPASRVLPLDAVASALESPGSNGSNAAPGGAGPAAGAAAPATGGEIVLVAFPPNPERALAVVRDIGRRTSASILAVGPATDTKLVLRALREGASEYLDLADLRNELFEALQRLDTVEQAAGRIVVVLAPSGGSGASTVAVNVATGLAQKQASCALLDLKLGAGDLAPLLDLKPTHTVADLCRNVERMDQSLLQGCLAPTSTGVKLLAAPARIADVGLVTPEAIDVVLSLISRHFPFIVVDLDHSFRAEQTRALLKADMIVLILRLDFVSLRNTRITLDFFKEIGVPRDRVRIVANRSGQPGELSPSQAEESLGIKISNSIPDDPRTVNRANNNGVPVVIEAPSAKVSRALLELAANLAEPVKTGG
jgi:pilus assembly protein CpaE